VDIKNCYFGYSKLLFLISRIIILDIRNYAEKAFYFTYPNWLFWIFEIVIYDIWNSFFRYLKLLFQYFGYPKYILDITNYFLI